MIQIETKDFITNRKLSKKNEEQLKEMICDYINDSEFIDYGFTPRVIKIKVIR